LYGTAEAPSPFPELENDETWVPMKTVITNEKGEEIAVCTTRWQVKSWAKIAADRAARETTPQSAAAGAASETGH
jgi:hypothetical protein